MWYMEYNPYQKWVDPMTCEVGALLIQPTRWDG